MTEVWFRNPLFYVKQIEEVGHNQIIFDGGYLAHNRIDPIRFMQLHYREQPWRLLVVEYSKVKKHSQDQWCVEYDQDFCDRGKPKLTHPVIDLNKDDWIEVKQALNNGAQRIVFWNWPHAQKASSTRLLNLMMELKRSGVLFHLHEKQSFDLMFGSGFDAADFEGRYDAQRGTIYLPNGKKISGYDAGDWIEWVRLNGMKVSDLDEGPKRCIFNLRSALWAAKFYDRELRFQTSAKQAFVDKLSSTLDYVPDTNKSIHYHRLPRQEGDIFLCDTCSLQTSCKYFRTGAVCAVPDSEPQELARFFNTRSSDVIIEGLGTLLATQTRRLELGIIDEVEKEKLNPEVTKILNSIFDRGVKLAKLVNPQLAAAGAAQVNVKLQQNVLNAQTPQALIAGIVSELELQGIPRDRITPEMIENLLGGFEHVRQQAVEAAAVEKEIIELEEMGELAPRRAV